MAKLEAAVEEKGPNGEKSCSDMASWEPPSDKLGFGPQTGFEKIFLQVSGIRQKLHFIDL